MKAVNLLPKDVTGGRRLASAPVILAFAAPVIAGSLVLVGYSAEHAKIADKRGQLDAVRAQIDVTAPRTAQPVDLGALASLRTARRAALADALSKELPWDTTLRDLARVMPSDVWLTQLSATSPTPADAVTAAPSTAAPATAAPASTPNSFTITGYTYSQDSVAHLLARLSLLPMLSDVALGSTTSAVLGAKTLVQFQVTAVVQPPVPRSET